MGGRAGFLAIALLAVITVLAVIVALTVTPVLAGTSRVPAGTPPGPVAADGGGWRWPLRPPILVLRRFDPPGAPWEAGHRGVDLAAGVGRPVHAAAPGQVGYAGRIAGRGVVTVAHGASRTTYVPVDASVRTGQRVPGGGRIGVVEDSGAHCGARNCLHWGLLRLDRYIDPLAWLGGGPVRLLPLWGGARTAPTAPGGPPAAPPRPASAGMTGRLGSVSAPTGTTAPPGTEGTVSAPAASAMPAGPAEPTGASPPGGTAPVRAAEVTGAAAGGAGIALLLVALPRVVRLAVRSVRRRRLPLNVVDFVRERERRRGDRR